MRISFENSDLLSNKKKPENIAIATYCEKFCVRANDQQRSWTRMYAIHENTINPMIGRRNANGRLQRTTSVTRMSRQNMMDFAPLSSRAPTRHLRFLLTVSIACFIGDGRSFGWSK